LSERDEGYADFFAVDFLAVDFLAGAFFAVLAFFAGAFLAVDFVAVFLAGADFLAAVLVVDFFAAVDFAAVFFAGADFFAAAFAGVDFLAAEVFFAGADFEAVFFAVPAAALAVPVAAFSVSFGSFFAPETTAFSSAPALNFGTAVFLALMLWPVLGLRTVRAGRMRFSKEPNPVMATFSPLATSRMMVSSTFSSASRATLRFPS